MKLAKLILVFLLIGLLVVLQVGVLSQEAKKVEAPALGSNVNLKAAGLDLAKMTLVEHTFNCLTDCHSVVEFTPLRDFTYDFDTVSGYYVNGTESNGVKSLTYTLQKEVTKLKQVDTFGNSCSIVNANGTDYESCNIVKTGYENQTYTDYETLPFSGLKSFNIGEKYRIAVDLKREPKLGLNLVDWRLNFNEFEVPWAWFFTNYSFKRQINTTHSSSGVLNNFTFLVNGTTGFNLGGNTNQIVWAKSNINETNYLYYNNNSDYDFTNGSENAGLCNWVEYGNTTTKQSCTWSEMSGRYGFEEGSGTTVADNVDGDKNLTTDSAAWENDISICKFGTCIDTANSHYAVTNSNKIAPYDEATISFWFNAKSWAQGNGLFSQIPPSQGNEYISMYQMAANNGIEAGVASGGTYCSASVTGFNTGQWYHIAWSVNSTSSWFYVNGVLNKTDTTGCSGTFNTASISALSYIGFNSYYEQLLPFNGYIDEFRVRNGMVNANEIKREYEQGLSIMGDEITKNDLPNTPDITYNVSTAYNLTDLNCSTATGISDPNGDSMTVLFNLSIDGVTAERILTNQLNGSHPSWIIAAANYSKNQTVKCNITLYDGSLYSASNSTSIVISNSVPVLENYNSSSLNRTEVNYTNQQNVAFSENETVMFNINVSDNDTSDSHWYSWFVDNSQEQSSESSWFDWVLDLFSSGFHTVRVVVNDSSNDNVTHQWNVNVINEINKFWSVDFVSPTPADNSNLSSASVNISVQISQSLLEDSEPREIYHNGSGDFTGTFNLTELNNTDKSIQLSYANLTGTYTSNIYDAGKNTVWTSLKWSSFLPTNGELGSGASMVGLWHMNEADWNGTTGEVVDSSSNNNSGTSNGADTVSDGRFYHAGNFDGIDDYVSIPSTLGDELDITSDMTITTWIKWKGPSDPPSIYYPRIVEKDYLTSYMFSLRPDDATRLSVWLQNSERASTATGSLSMNEWHHVGFTFNDSSNAVKIYIDGIERGSGSFTGALSGNTNNVYIGRYPGSAVAYFNGTIDDMAIWNRSLAPEEIQDIYNSTVSDIKFQARSCDDSLCSGESFVGPSGSSSYYINEAAESLSNLAVNRYFQYKTYLETDSAALTPKLFNVTVSGDTVAVYSTANTSKVWIDINGANVTMTGSNSLYSYVNNSLTFGEYNYRVYSNDSYGNINFTEKRMFNVPSYNITFNVTSGETGLSIDNIDSITCTYSSFSKGSDTTNPYGPYAFPVGTWSCTFEKANYYNRTITFIADQTKMVGVIISFKGYLTIEEHNQLDWLYNCIRYGICDLYSMVESTNLTTGKIWQQYLPTDKSVLQQETFLSNLSSPASNITINYTIKVPLKEGFNDKELLPLRIFYWFTDTNGTCYNQDKESSSNKAETPFCIPLMAEYLGPNNGTVSFRVDLHPNLPSGTYQVVRSIDIDPPVNGELVWINYGREQIGVINVVNDLLQSSSTEQNQEPSVQANAPALTRLNGITGSVIDNVKSLGGGINLNLIIVFAMLCLTVITLGRYKYKK